MHLVAVLPSLAIAVALLSIGFEAVGAPNAPGSEPSDPNAPSPSIFHGAAPPEPEPKATLAEEPPLPPNAPLQGGVLQSPNRPEVPRGSLEVRGGFALGGDTLVRATLTNGEERTLDAGKGAVLAVEGAVTPLWLGGDTVGLGGRIQVGLKYGSINASNGTISLMRWPLLLGLHTLIRLSDVTYLRIGPNIETHAGLSFNVSGDIGNGSVDLDSGLGVGGEVSLFFQQRGRPLCYDVAIQYTHIQYSAGGESADASNAGLTLGIGYAF